MNTKETTQVESISYIGKTVGIIVDRAGALTIHAVVKSYKWSYGHNRWLVSPVSGSGEIWVNELIDI